MTSENKKWVFRVLSGHIYGPFDKAKVLELLAKGVLTGEEEVAPYPAGDWKPWASEKELADVLFNILSHSKPRAKKEVTPTPTPVVERGTIKTKKIKKQEEEGPTKKYIELVEEKKIKRKTNTIPLLVIVLAGFFLIYFGLSRATKSLSGSSSNLIQPQPKQKGDPAKAQAYIKQGWSYFYRDTFSNYVKAQESFTRAVEEAPGNADAIAMLLLTDYQLWPYMKQDSNDLAVIQWLLQAASSADPYGPRRALASSVANLMMGNTQDALSQVDSALLLQPNEGRFYSLKAQNYFDSLEYEYAKNHFDKTASLLSFWVRPFYLIGVCYERMGRGAEASKYLSRALQMNSAHAAARLELGIVEKSIFKNSEKAKEHILAALNLKEKLLPSEEARGRLWLAIMYQESGDVSKAKIEAEKSFSLNPADLNAKKLLTSLGGDATKISSSPGTDKQFVQAGDQYLKLKNYLAAQAQYKAAFELNPYNAHAAMKAGDALWKLHQPSEAMQWLQRAISADNKFVAAHIRLAEYKTQRFDFSGAAALLDQAVKARPKSFEVYRAYAVFLFKRGDLVSAENYAKRALQIYETDVGSNQIMSKILLAKKDTVKAVQFARRAIEIDPRNVDAQVNYTKSKSQFEGVKSAQEYAKELIHTYPSELDYRLALAEILIQDEQYKNALTVLDQVLAFDNNSKEGHLLSGDAYFLNEKLDLAINAYFSAARVDPSDPAAIFRAADVYARAGKLAEAQKQLILVLNINPLFPRAHYNLAKVYFQSGQGDVALKELAEEKKLNPRLADPYELAGDIYLTMRRFAQASSEYQKASEIKPLSANIYVKQARAYRGQGSHDAALAMLRLASAKESGLAEIYREQGYVFEQKGMIEEALSSFRQYLRLEPNPADKKQILDKIKELGEQ